ncbi:MAG: hypothetical protein HY866_03180, partial [Chloroflexi bacterium]|nr:hypothetical protein [Chloroflexota bacterium]
GAYRDDWLSLDTLRDGLNDTPTHQRVISTTALDYAWFTVAGTDIHSLAGAEQFQAYLDSMPDMYLLFKLVPLTAVLSAAVLAGRSLQQRRIKQSPDSILVIWLLLPVLAFTWEWTEIAPHYMIPLMPAAYILCGAGAAVLLSVIRSAQARRVTLIGGAAILVIIAGLQVYLFAGLLRFLDDHATPGAFGTPLHYLLDVRDTILDRHVQDVIVISEEEIAPYDQEPAVWGALLDSVPQVRFVNGTRTAVIPVAPALELIAWVPGLRICADQTCQDQPDVEVFERRPGEAPYLLRPAQEQVVNGLNELSPIRFANGAYLVGYAVHETSVVLVWELSGTAQADYQAFVHALDANGAKIAQADRPTWPGKYWRAGDRLILWFDLTVPPEAVSLYTGMYTLDGDNYRAAEVLDNNGAYVDQAATIPLNAAD